MSDFELLSLFMMIFGIVIPLLIAYIDAKKITAQSLTKIGGYFNTIF